MSSIDWGGVNRFAQQAGSLSNYVAAFCSAMLGIAAIVGAVALGIRAAKTKKKDEDGGATVLPWWPFVLLGLCLIACAGVVVWVTKRSAFVRRLSGYDLLTPDFSFNF